MITSPIAGSNNNTMMVGNNTTATLPYAGFWLRALAAFIDLMSAAFIFSVGFLIDLFDEDPFVSQTNQVIVFLLIAPIFYYPIMECLSWQGTLGKKIVGLKVTDLNGQRIGPAKAFKRLASKFLSFILVLSGFFMVAFTEKKQALHDKVAHTLVIKG